jgi:hypothetical protein
VRSLITTLRQGPEPVGQHSSGDDNITKTCHVSALAANSIRIGGATSRCTELAAADADYAAGNTISGEELRRRYGLS